MRRRPPHWNRNWRPPKRRLRVSAGEVRMVLLGGIFAGLVAVWSLDGPPLASASAPDAAAERVAFGMCDAGGGRNCVIDGDTFRLHGDKIRIADIDAPETHPPRCAREAELGARATQRLQALLNAGPVALAPADRDTDSYGRKLRIVRANGVEIGDALVAEGLARRWEGRRRPWC